MEEKNKDVTGKEGGGKERGEKEKEKTARIILLVVLQYVREVFRLLGDDMAYRELGDQALEFTLTWIQQFVLPKCERGRGTRPR